MVTTAPPSAPNVIRLESRMVPSPALADDETILGDFYVRPPLLGRLCGHKNRLIVTNTRLFFFQRRLLASSLQALELAKIEMLWVAGQFRLLRFLFGLLLLAPTVVICFVTGMDPITLYGRGFMGISEVLAYGYWYLPPTSLLALVSCVTLLVGILLLMRLRVQVLRVAAGGARNVISLPTQRLRRADLETLVNTLSGALRGVAQK